MAEIFLYFIPVVILILFIVNLIQCIKCPKDEAHKHKKIGHLISTIVFGILTVIIVGFFIMLMLALSHM